MKPPLICISIVTYNAEKDISACLDAVLQQTYSEYELIVVDNQSSDRTVEIVQSYAPRVRLIESGGNIGFGAAHNIAIANSHADWHLFLNADALLEPTALEEFVSGTTNSSIGAIGGILYRDTDKSEIDSTGILLNPLTYHAKERKIIPPSNDYPWGISGACVMVKKTALESIAYVREDRNYPEYFDESFFLYKEDLDLAARLMKQSWKSLFLKKDIAIHARTGKEETKRSDLPTYVNEQSYKNHFLFLLKAVKWYAIPTVLCYEFTKFCYLLLFERSTLRVLPQVIQLAPKMIKRRYA